MLIRDSFRTNFYDVVRKKHVVIVVANDVDALCASVILTHLFGCDDVAYSLVPVASWEGMEKALHEYFEQGSNFVLLNCGAYRPLLQLAIPPSSTVFVVDSRRPIDVDNIYNPDQIRVVCLGKEVDEELNIPPADAIYAEDDSEDEEDEGEDEDEEEDEDDEGIDENREPKKRKKKGGMDNLEMRVLKREQKRRWEKRRGDLLWEYYEWSWVATSSCIVLLSVAAELSRATAELVWLSSIALSSQLNDSLISPNGYTLQCVDCMQPYIAKYAPRGAAKADDLLRIKFEREIPLPFYQHWSLLQAMTVNKFFACKTRNWTQRGDNEMKHLLAEIGLTLQECRQKFTAMTLERRTEVVSLIEKAMACKFASFFVQLGYTERMSAYDVSRALSTWLGSSNRFVLDSKGVSRQLTLADRFEDCRKLLRSFITATTEMDRLHRMIALSKSELETIWTAASAVVNQSEVIPNDTYYLYLSNRPRDRDIASAAGLFAFTHFIAAAFSANRKGRSRRPLVVGVPYEEEGGYHLVMGVMPLATVDADHNLKSFMGRAFERVGKKPRIGVKAPFFRPDMVLVKSEDLGRFLDELQKLLDISVS